MFSEYFANYMTSNPDGNIPEGQLWADEKKISLQEQAR